MKYCKINLSKTNYSILPNANKLTLQELQIHTPHIKDLYKRYCEYKKFDSVVPLFESIIYDSQNDVIGYMDKKELIAFSIIKKYDSENAESLQFAWNYENPKLRLGIESIKHECAWYKKLGFKFLYLGIVDKYKQQFDGYTEIGPL